MIPLLKGSLQGVHPVGLFPGYAQILAAHVAVGRQLAIDRLSQVQIPDDGGGPQVKDLLHSLFQILIPHRTGTEGIHQYADGLGHAVYTMSDPRAVVIKKYAAALARDKGRADDLELMERVEELGIRKIMTRKHQSIPMCANVDLYSGLIYSMLDIPEDMYTPLFATARIAGWCAHRLEELATGNRIMRPAYRAMLMKVPYIPVEARE